MQVTIVREVTVGQNRTIYTAKFKSKVAMEAIQGDETISNIAKKYEIHPNQISIWKTELIEGANNIVDRKRGKKPASEEPDREELLKTIGQLNVENDFLKKNLACSVEQKNVLINPEHATLSVSRQCELLELPRSTYTFQPAGKTSLNLELMVRLDEEESRHPLYGYRKMTEYRNECGYQINRKRVSR